MTDRPTPEQIISLLDFHGALTPHMRRQLEGYVIVHPDDVQIDPSLADTEYGRGFTDCRGFIFGEGS